MEARMRNVCAMVSSKGDKQTTDSNVILYSPSTRSAESRD
jgi:hypothetical protein